MAKPVPNSKETARSGCCIGIFIILVAIPFLGFFAWKAYQDVRCFTQYRPTNCRIVNKRMIQHSGSKGSTYRPEFDFEFEDDQGHTIRTSGYDTWAVSTSGKSGQQKILDSYEIGKTYPCWYDPSNPSRAVLVRQISWMYLLVLLPLFALLIGFYVIRGSLRDGGRQASPESKALKSRPSPVGKGSGPVPSPQTSPGQVLPVALESDKSNEPGIGCLVFSVVLVMSGVVVYGQWAKSLWGLALILVILGAIGSILCIMTLAGRRRVNKVQVEATAAELVPGQPLECWVRLTGQTELNGLTVRLICEERATYRQGTDTRVDKQKVVEELLVEQGLTQVNPLEPLEVRGRTIVPLNAMHSFKASRNEIAWFLQVDCDIPRWPDAHYVFPLKVAARWNPADSEHGGADA